MSVLWEERPEPAGTEPAFWRPGTVLTLFFAASLISAVFFGLGYSFGRRATAAPRGYAGQTADGGGRGTSHAGHAAVGRAGAVDRHGSEAPTADAAAMAATQSDATARGGLFMVQVGATRSRRRARRLVAELRRRGFQAEIHRGRHGRHLSVQIGPFRTPEEASRVRHKVAESGYRAVLKRAS